MLRIRGSVINWDINKKPERNIYRFSLSFHFSIRKIPKRRCHKLIIPTFIDFSRTKFSLASVVHEMCCYVSFVYIFHDERVYVYRKMIFPHFPIERTCSCAILLRYARCCSCFSSLKHFLHIPTQPNARNDAKLRPCPSTRLFHSTAHWKSTKYRSRHIKRSITSGEREGENLKLRSWNFPTRTQPVSCSFAIHYRMQLCFSNCYVSLVVVVSCSSS